MSNDFVPSKLDGRASLTVHQILSSFSAPLKEEHAWALTYQFVVGLRGLPFPTTHSGAAPYFIPNECKHIYIREDGHIHQATFSNPLGYKRDLLMSKNKCLLELGLILFSALDFGLKDEEERSFSRELEDLFNLINSAENINEEDEHKCDDEGIERDEDDHEELESFNEISKNILSNYQINPLMEIVKKKVIKVDESLKSEILNFEDDDVKNTKKNNRRSMVENSLNLASIVKNNPCRRTQSFCGNSTYKNKRSRSRPRRKLFIDTHFSALTDTSSSPISTPEAESLPGSPNFDSGSFDFDDSIECSLNTSQMHASLQSEFLSSEQWETALQTLHLSFEEVVHIRSVLTKAEMEGLPLDGTFKEDVEKGKVCFLCMRTRFGIFTWSHKCQMCQQFVCNKCSSKRMV
ncbi:uncharacterized protein [Lepeophtheirus salmonis]|uniref:uncharacterized protein isoform X2 n=1 Tax=Lepeophtheirus salmonis TaxID=72036 RepID=UPI003AF3592B